MNCLICNSGENEVIHEGTRDNSEINVLKCCHCGMVFLNSKEYNSATAYEEEAMRKNAYSGVKEEKSSFLEWDDWIRNSANDDERRYQQLKDVCRNKKVLDFGCGCGGFLRRIKEVAQSVTGVELSQEAITKLNQENIRTLKSIDETDDKFDVIVSFHVIEHINNPDEWLATIKSHLNENGIFVCETPNGEDALISLYNCKAFEDFTYWSEHVFLYNSDALSALLRRQGFYEIQNTQIMRYNIANHLYWLSQGKPGGHKKWEMFNDIELVREYEKVLVNEKKADTLWCISHI